MDHTRITAANDRFKRLHLVLLSSLMCYVFSIALLALTCIQNTILRVSFPLVTLIGFCIILVVYAQLRPLYNEYKSLEAVSVVDEQYRNMDDDGTDQDKNLESEQDQGLISSSETIAGAMHENN